MRLSTVLPLFLLPLFATAAPPTPDVKDESVKSFTEELTGDTFDDTTQKGIWYVRCVSRAAANIPQVRETLFAVLQAL
jgi:hypothetical protein